MTRHSKTFSDILKNSHSFHHPLFPIPLEGERIEPHYPLQEEMPVKTRVRIHRQGLRETVDII